MTKKKSVSYVECGLIAPSGKGSPSYAYSPSCWGEQGAGADGVALSDRMRGSSFVKSASYAGDPLVYAFVGKSSRLVWWTGPSGLLEEAMPVLSEWQLEGTDQDAGKTVRDELSDLWLEWSKSDPTSAAALVEWVSKAILISSAVRDVAVRSSVDFIRFDTDDVLEDVPGELFKLSVNFREHTKEAIFEWFSRNATSYRMTEQEMVDDRPAVRRLEIKSGDTKRWPIPDWYMDVDPVRSLPADERDELLSLMQAMTGQLVTDSKPRFGGNASYRKVCDLVVLMHEYQRLVDEIVNSRLKKVLLRKDELASNKEAQSVYGQAIDDLLRSYGWDTETTPYRKLVQDRLRKTEGRAWTSSFYLEVLAKVFGNSVLDDGIVKAMVEFDGKSPLTEYDQLFRVDPKAKTIVHHPEFARQFALSLGTHSECVARRIARHVYELYQKGSRQLERGHRAELARIIGTLSAYRIPCPRQLENELTQRLPEPQKARFSALWEKDQEDYIKAQYRFLKSEEDEEVRYGFEDRVGTSIMDSKLSRVRVATPNGLHRRFIANPVHFLFSSTR